MVLGTAGAEHSGCCDVWATTAVLVLAMTHQRPETLPAVGWEPGESKADILGVGEVQTAHRFCSLVGFSRLRVPRGCAAPTGVKGFPSCPLPRCNSQSVDTDRERETGYKLHDSPEEKC